MGAATQECAPGDAVGYNPKLAVLDVDPRRALSRSLDFAKSVRGPGFFVFGLIVGFVVVVSHRIGFHVFEGDFGLCPVAS